jgi:hypothetical protein
MTLEQRVKRLEQRRSAKACRCGLKHYATLPIKVEICRQCGGAILDVVIDRADGFSIGRIGGEFKHYKGFSFADI